MHYKRASIIALLAMLAFVFGSAEACKITVKPPGSPSHPTATATPTPTSTTPAPEPTTFPGDEGFATVFTVIPADETPGEGEVAAGTYETPGPLAGQPADTCDYLQTRVVPLGTPIEDETTVVAHTDDAALPPAPEGPAVPAVDTDNTVVLAEGDKVSADGCQDFALQS